MNILMILLGCNIGSILLNRLETSFRFIENNLFEDYNSTIKITWFLSGGIKNNFKGAETEAFIMKSQIDNNIGLKYNDLTFKKFNWDFVLDDKSTNTAENFIWASNFLNTTTKTFESVYIITSLFHYERASLMLKLIDPSRNFKWILGDMEEKDSKYWESIHIMNVESDVKKARIKLDTNLLNL